MAGTGELEIKTRELYETLQDAVKGLQIPDFYLVRPPDFITLAEFNANHDAALLITSQFFDFVKIANEYKKTESYELPEELVLPITVGRSIACGVCIYLLEKQSGSDVCSEELVHMIDCGEEYQTIGREIQSICAEGRFDEALRVLDYVHEPNSL